MEEETGAGFGRGAREREEILQSKGVACAEALEEAGSMFCLGFGEQVCQTRAELVWGGD